MAAKSKGAPKRARARKSRSLYALEPEAELGAGTVVDDVVAQLIRTLAPTLLAKLVERVNAPPKAPPADLEGRLLRMETQVGFLSTTLRALADRVVVLEAERRH